MKDSGGWISKEGIFQMVCLLALALPLLLLFVLLAGTFSDGWGRLGWSFLTGAPSRHAANAGLFPAFVGTIMLMGLTTLMAVPIGIGAAIYLQEYARPSRLTSIIELNI